MKPLSGVDGLFLHLETPETPMHVASLHLYDRPAGRRADFHAAMKRRLRARLPLAPVLTRKLAAMPLQFANPVWVQADDIDLDWHVKRVQLPAPGTQAQLEACAARLHGELLDRSRPLWQLTVIEGLQSGQAAYYIKVHHAVLDGQAGVQLGLVLCDMEPHPAPHRRPAALPAEHPGMAALAASALRHDAAQYLGLLRHLPELLRSVAGLFAPAPASARGRLGQNFSFGPRTVLNRPIDGERSFAAATLPLATLKTLAAAHDAKLNDIVLALCSGALRRWLATHGGVPRKPLIASMPISLREAGNTEYTTQATLSLVNLQTHRTDPLRRLRAIRDGALAVKTLAQRARQAIPTDFPSIGTPWLLQALATLYGRSGVTKALPPIANVVISNVPGPPMPLYAAGARMATYWPMSIVEHGVGLNITVMSYAGTMGFGFTAAHCAVPDASELVRALHEALDELVACTPAQPAARKRRAQPAPRKRQAQPPAPRKRQAQPPAPPKRRAQPEPRKRVPPAAR